MIKMISANPLSEYEQVHLYQQIRSAMLAGLFSLLIFIGWFCGVWFCGVWFCGGWEAIASSLPDVPTADVPIAEVTAGVQTAGVQTAAFSAENLFDANCAACHANGGNIIRRGKNLKQKALSRYGYDSAESIESLVRQGKGAMPSYVDRLNEDEIGAIAQYVLSQANSGW